MENNAIHQVLKSDASDDTGTNTSGVRSSFWLDSTAPITYTELNYDAETDIAIIGGGIAGLSIAYTLCREGKNVIVLEDGNIASGETGRTTAHLVNALDDRYYDLEKFHGEKGARLAAESHTAAINQIEKIVREEAIDCDFERLDGFLFTDPTDETNSINKEFEATRRAGIYTSILTHVPGIPSEDKICLRFPDQAQLHPLKYIAGLCKSIINKGGKIFTQTHVKSINNNIIKTSNGYTIKSKHTIVATNTPINDTFALHTKQAAYRSYVIAAKIPKESVLKALWWDTGNQESEWSNYPYHYVRTCKYNDQYDLIICGGEDHKTGQTDNLPADRFKNLKEWCSKRFPMMGEIIFRWSGQVMEPVDSLAYIGRNPGDNKTTYVVTGDSGNGMTHGTIAGMLIPDIINGIANPWEELYDPNRISFKTAGTFVSENANVIKQFGDYLTSGDIAMKDLNHLEPEKGAIIRNGMSKLAVYRDAFNELHAFSAVCPHLKCIVQWNEFEKTFDCPCHGSRFSCMGKVINGPANSDLTKATIEENVEAH